MPQVINTNVASLNSQRSLNMSQTSLATSLQRLSSGLRINSAKDDAAGLAISDRMSTQIRGLNQAARNANDGISLAQTAEGDLEQIGSNLQRMRELAVQAGNASNSASDRAALDSEVQALSAEIDRVAQNSSFNGTKLLDGSFVAQSFQIGANGTANDRVSIASIASARTSALGGSGTSTQTTLTGGATTAAALTAGALTLNGFQVGASSIGASAGQTAASAFSKAAAINLVSSQSGVTATAMATSVTGAVQTGFNGYTAANSFSVNGSMSAQLRLVEQLPAKVPTWPRRSTPCPLKRG
jgi:flagellin